MNLPPRRLGALLAALFLALTVWAALSCQVVRPPAASPGRPLTMFASADFSGSGWCGMCHGDLRDADGNDCSIDAHWRSTMMANAARDPYFLAKVSAEVMHNPGIQPLIEDKCAVCHMPMARTQSVVESEPVAMLQPGYLDADHALHETALDGVSCTLCHQVEEHGLGTAASYSGHYRIDTSTSPPDRLSYGPFPEPDQRLMRETSGFTPVQGDQVLDPGLCGTCHTLYTPYFDAQGNVLGEFPEQTPFLEWLHSSYSREQQSCQDCHMPAAAGQVRVSNRPRAGMLPARSPFALHHFVGGNAFMVKLLTDSVDALGLTCSSEQLEATRQRILQQLQYDAVTLTVAEAELASGQLLLALQLENRAGHKVPTGFPSRRAWLHVKVTDANGYVFFESGQPRPDGTIAGADGDQDAAAFEPHYEMVSSSHQVQIYESVMHDLQGQVTYTLLQAVDYLKDNRLLPRGFDKGSAGDDFATKGTAAMDDSFQGGGDRVIYQIDAQGQQPPFEISVELLYQSISHGFVRDIRQYDTELVTQFLQLYDRAEKMPLVIASAQATVD